MPTKKPQWLITVTTEMNEDMNNLVTSEEWTLNKSETIRLAVKQFLEKHGISVKETMPKRGTYNREDKEK